jgi:hypothetical protein
MLKSAIYSAIFKEVESKYNRYKRTVQVRLHKCVYEEDTGIL